LRIGNEGTGFHKKIKMNVTLSHCLRLKKKVVEIFHIMGFGEYNVRSNFS